MPQTAHGISMQEFYCFMAELEPEVDQFKWPAAWMRFCNWVSR